MQLKTTTISSHNYRLLFDSKSQNTDNQHFNLPNRYRYAFNGMEKDDEVKGAGNSYDFGARMYDSRLGRWLSIDNFYRAPISPYVGLDDNPILLIDPDGNVVSLATLDPTQQAVVIAAFNGVISSVGLKVTNTTAGLVFTDVKGNMLSATQVAAKRNELSKSVGFGTTSSHDAEAAIVFIDIVQDPSPSGIQLRNIPQPPTGNQKVVFTIDNMGVLVFDEGFLIGIANIVEFMSKNDPNRRKLINKFLADFNENLGDEIVALVAALPKSKAALRRDANKAKKASGVSAKAASAKSASSPTGSTTDPKKGSNTKKLADKNKKNSKVKSMADLEREAEKQSAKYLNKKQRHKNKKK